jgi:F-type H+-transporting ATPase subunit gamma
MAHNMRDIKRRIKSVSSMEHITNAMKLVSSAKLRKAKNIFDRSQENFHFITESIEEVFHNSDDVPAHYLRGNREIKTTAYIVLSSCRGLCGSFNSNVIKYTQSVIDAYPDENKPYIVAIGDKTRDYFSRRGFEILSDYCLPPEDITFQESHDISKPVIEMYDRGEIDEICMVYTHFINTLQQKVVEVTLLPFDVSVDPYEHIVQKEVEYEPSVEAVFNYLVPKYVETKIYSAIVESAVCEHAARRMAMESATDNARDMISDLTLTYNRTRQAAITSEISEIVGGAEALG